VNVPTVTETVPVSYVYPALAPPVKVKLAGVALNEAGLKPLVDVEDAEPV
jgi:hypothetical protein